jgi:alpha-L-arabinofuranosidase
MGNPRLVLSGDAVNDANTREEPDRIAPVTDEVPCRDGRLECVLPRLSLTRLRLRRAAT